MRPSRLPISLAGISLLLALSSCRPVLAIGWDELLIIILVIALLFTPLLLRIARVLAKSRKSKKKERE